MDAAAAWIYRGVWASVVGFFKVPEEPSTLPAAGEPVRSLRPSPGYLRYLKFLFWVALIPGDILPVVGWIAVSIAVPVLGVVLAVPFLALMFLPDIFAYVGIHLRYDTTWYVLTDRSLRIRRGIMTIHETTISFENVQNVEVRQGPLQRYFGIADVLVTTAGGGVASHGKGPDVVARRARRHPAGPRRRRGGAQPDPRQRRADAIGGPRRRASAARSARRRRPDPALSRAAPGRAARDSRQRPPSRAVVSTRIRRSRRWSTHSPTERRSAPGTSLLTDDPAVGDGALASCREPPMSASREHAAKHAFLRDLLGPRGYANYASITGFMHAQSEAFDPRRCTGWMRSSASLLM